MTAEKEAVRIRDIDGLWRILGCGYGRCITDEASPEAVSSARLQSELLRWSGFEKSGSLYQHTHMASPSVRV